MVWQHAVELEAGDFNQSDAFIKVRIRWPREHVDLVAKVAQSTAQILNVNALPADVWMTTVT